MSSNIEMFRPGIALVSDEHVLDAIAGGESLEEDLAAVINTVTKASWGAFAITALAGVYKYGDPAQRQKVINMCRQFGVGVRQIGRDGIYLYIAGSNQVATWVQDYFRAAAVNNDSATTTTELCPEF